MTRQAEASRKTKAKIVEVARELFIKKGYSETSLKDILSAGNISKGNLYHHFRGKEFLFLHIVEEDYTEWLNQWKEREVHSRNAVEKLYDFAHFSIQTSFNSPFIHATEEFFASAFKSKEVIETITCIEEQYFEVIENILKEGIREGSWKIENIYVTTKVVSSLFFGLESMLKDNVNQDRKKIYEESVRILVKGLQ